MPTVTISLPLIVAPVLVLSIGLLLLDWAAFAAEHHGLFFWEPSAERAGGATILSAFGLGGCPRPAPSTRREER